MSDAFRLPEALDGDNLDRVSDRAVRRTGEDGSYPKLVLVDREHGRPYLFKVYRRPDHRVVGAAEVAASRVRALLDPGGTVQVGHLMWRDLPGTIQPFLVDAVPLTVDRIRLDGDVLASVLAEHPIDWLVSNHDAHAGHVLLCGGRIGFIDKAQAFRYFPDDRLDPRYHPNGDRGRLEQPVYNALYRSVPLPAAPPPLVARRAEEIRALPDDELVDCLDELAGVREPSAGSRTRFLDGVLRRRDSIGASFADLYRSLHGVRVR